MAKKVWRSRAWLSVLILAAAALGSHMGGLISPQWVETQYLRNLYPRLTLLTRSLTNLAPFSLTQPALVIWVGATLIVLVRRWREQTTWAMRLGRSFFTLILSAAFAYLLFWLMWGILYLRPPVEHRLDLDDRVSNIEAYALRLVGDLNRLRESAHESSLKDAEESVRSQLARLIQEEENREVVLPDRVKRNWPAKTLSTFGVSGVLSPWLHEPHVERNLLDYEAPFTVAHELSHAAGVSGEAEANFWAYLACLRSDHALAQYSGAMSLLRHMISDIGAESRRTVLDGLSDGVKDDWNGINDRIRGDRWKTGAGIQRRAYNQFLKSQGIGSGVRDYGRVVELVLKYDAQRAR